MSTKLILKNLVKNEAFSAANLNQACPKNAVLFSFLPGKSDKRCKVSSLSSAHVDPGDILNNFCFDVYAQM